MTTLQSRCDAFEALYDFLKVKEEDQAIALLQRMRAGTDLETIMAALQDISPLRQLSPRPEIHFRYTFPYKREMPFALRSGAWSNPYIDSILYRTTYEMDSQDELSEETVLKPRQAMYLVPYHAVELLDGRLASIDMTKWTAVPTSNSLLLSLLETCEFLKSHFLEEFFLEKTVNNPSQGQCFFGLVTLQCYYIQIARARTDKSLHRFHFRISLSFGFPQGPFPG